MEVADQCRRPELIPEATTTARTPRLHEFAARAVQRGREAARAGAVTGQIPALATIDPTSFGFAVALLDGTEIAVGDALQPFSLQSISKLFSLCALLRADPAAWAHVGWDASGAGYNSVSELELHAGRPRNPFVNAGALIVTDRLLDHAASAADATSALVAELCGEEAPIDEEVARSEAQNGHLNQAITHVLAQYGRLQHDIDLVLAEYVRQCAISTHALAVARSGRFLATRGVRGPLDPASVRRVNAVLLTAGMYGAAGDIAYRIGLPAKSGIAGGVLAIMPGVGCVCAWSPPLDATGNSIGAVVAIETFAELAGWSVF